MITAYIFLIVRVPMIQKNGFRKKTNFLCLESITITDIETGEIICQRCGIVVQDTNSYDRRDNIFTKSINVNQVDNRASLRLHDMGLATVIDKFNHDSKGKPITYKIRQDMNRMRLWDSRSHAKNTTEPNLRTALSEMEKLKEKLSLSDAIIERSAYLYRKASKAQLI